MLRHLRHRNGAAVAVHAAAAVAARVAVARVAVARAAVAGAAVAGVAADARVAAAAEIGNREATADRGAKAAIWSRT